MQRIKFNHLRHFVIIVMIATLSVRLVFSQYKANVSKVWVANKGDGSYHPVLYADYSDPDAYAQ